MNELIVSVALTGAITSKKEAPNLPVTKEEIAADVIRCAKAGAAIAHIHIRDSDGQGTMDTGVFVETVDHIREELAKSGVDIVLNLTTSGSATATESQRFAHLRHLKPEMCSYDVGSLNWLHTSVFLNPPDFLEKMGLFTQELRIKPEIEIFDGGMIENAKYYIKKGILKPPHNFQLVLGAAGGIPGTVQNLIFLYSLLPPESHVSASGIGRWHMPVLLTALALGFDGIRVGLEDNALMTKGVPATNVLLVERAVDIAVRSGRAIASADQARKRLGLEKHA
jgi:Uncharacterized conserved protein